MVSIESRVTSLVLRSKISPFVFPNTLSSPGASEHEDSLASKQPWRALNLFFFEELPVLVGGEELALVGDAEPDHPPAPIRVLVYALGAVV